MKIIPLLLSLLASLASPSRADTIYQMNDQGRQVVVQRDAIVVSEDSAFVVYKHFDLKDRRVEIVRLNKGSLPYSVQTASPDYRRQIVDVLETLRLQGHGDGPSRESHPRLRCLSGFLPARRARLVVGVSSSHHQLPRAHG